MLSVDQSCHVWCIFYIEMYVMCVCPKQIVHSQMVIIFEYKKVDSRYLAKGCS